MSGDIIHIVEIDAPRPTVFKAIASQRGLRNWWNAAAEAEPGVGSTIEVRFIGDFNPTMEVLSYEEAYATEWRVVGGHESWQDSRLVFQLSDAGDGSTRLMFRQSFHNGDVTEEAWGEYNFQWGYYLDSLRQYCETGRGKPHGRRSEVPAGAV